MFRLNLFALGLAFLCCGGINRVEGIETKILTPATKPTPQINGPRVFGVRPGSPFLYHVPVTGERPMTYAAEGLPEGLTLDSKGGNIEGTVAKAGEYPVLLKAQNSLGKTEKSFRIVVGSQIALTPPMGWNSWNCWGGKVSQEKVLSSARAMAEKGLIDHGWRYINIDDGWQGMRGGSSNGIQPNAKFPDMKRLGAQLHQMGFAFGIYSTPWRGTYEGHVGTSSDNADGTYEWIKSGDHNADFRIGSNPSTWDPKRRSNYRFGTNSFVNQDVAQWVEWGVDYLKYDWNPIDVDHTKVMSDALAASGRDIAYSLSNATPFKDALVLTPLANAWRTTGDIRETWESVSNIGFNQDKWAPFQKPGHFNDPDMLVVGKVGWGDPHPTKLTPDEQYTHVSLWCLLSAPLLLGCDLAELDPFTLGLLTNDEVLAIDQDSLAGQAIQVSSDKDIKIYAKILEDGSWAVGLFNTGASETVATVKWDDLKIKDRQTVRDLWRQKDLGKFDHQFSSPVKPHGVILLRLVPG